MPTKKPAPKKRKATRRRQRASQSVPCVLDVAIHFSSHIIQHVALHYHTPPAEWTSGDVLAAANRVADLLPRSEAIEVRSAMWIRDTLTALGQLQFHVIASAGDYPYLQVSVSECPVSTFLRCFEEQLVIAAATWRATGAWVVRTQRQRSPDGISPEPGTLRDRFPQGGYEDQREHDKSEQAAIAAARRAAKLPLPKRDNAA